MKHYDEEKVYLVKEFGKIDSMSLTTDTWKSGATESYITVTENHINSEWEMRSNVLLTREMPERHNADNLVSKLQSCMSEFGLSDKIVTVVHDNARNMESAMNVTGLG